MHIARYKGCNRGRITHIIVEEKLILFHTDQHEDITRKYLPKEINEKIFAYMMYDNDPETLEEAIHGMRAIACTNKFLNAYINDTQETFKQIKKFSEKFEQPHMLIARHLCTSGARRIYGMQNGLLIHWNSFESDKLIQMHIVTTKPIGLDLDFLDEQGKTILWKALFCVGAKYDRIALSLVQNGANILLRNSNGKNALMLALLNGSLLTVKEILSSNKELDINHQDEYKNTALHYWYRGFICSNYAVNKSNFYEALELLLAVKDINPTIRNEGDKTILNLIETSDLFYSELYSKDKRKIIEALKKAEDRFNANNAKK
jgi:hypothetical protein